MRIAASQSSLDHHARFFARGCAVLLQVQYHELRCALVVNAAAFPNARHRHSAALLLHVIGTPAHSDASYITRWMNCQLTSIR